MAKIEVRGKSKEDLGRLMTAIDAELARRDKEDRKDALKAARAAAAKYGFSLADLLQPKGSKRRTSAKETRRAKYADPASNKTWSGMGRQPGWFKAAIEKGATPGYLLVSYT